MTKVEVESRLRYGKAKAPYEELTAWRGAVNPAAERWGAYFHNL